MPQLSVVPNPVARYPVDLLWPRLALSTNAGTAWAAGDLNGMAYSGALNTASVFAATTGTGTKIMTVYKDLVCGQFACSAGNNIESDLVGMSAYVPLTKNGILATQKAPEQYRFFWWQWLMAKPVAATAFTPETGFILEPKGVTGASWPTAANGGVGIIGDGAGGWQFGAKKLGGAGPFTVTQPLVWPVALDEWCQVDFTIVGASGQGDASFTLSLGGSVVLTFPWGVGSILPDYTSTANALRLAPYFRLGDAGAPAGAVNFTALRFRAGMFTQNDAQL